MADLRHFHRSSIDGVGLREQLDQVRLAQQVRAAQAAWDAVTGTVVGPLPRQGSSQSSPERTERSTPRGPAGRDNMAEVDLSPAEAAAMDVVDLPNNRAPVLWDLIDLPGFQLLVVLVVVANMYVLALETDDANPTTRWLWPLLDGLFLMFYATEFTFRILQRGPSFLLVDGRSRMWIWFDLLLVLLGLADFIASCIQAATGRETTGVSMVWMLHMTLLLRIFRIFRMHRKLQQCVEQLGSMYRIFAWILAIIFMSCFVLAVILTQVIGEPSLFGDNEMPIPEAVQELFSSTAIALFTLFKLITLDDWVNVANPLIEWNPLWSSFVYAFIVIMPWTMLSLLTAVASETMISATTNKRSAESIQERRGKRFVNFLIQEFKAADVDDNDCLNKEEFMTLMNKETVQSEMSLSGMTVDDLEKTWDTFDVDGSGELSVEELVHGFALLQEMLASKHVAGISYAMKRLNVDIEATLDEMEAHVGEQAGMQEQHLQRFLALEQRSRETCRAFEWKPNHKLRNARASLETMPGLAEETDKGAGLGVASFAAAAFKKSLSRSLSRNFA